MDQPNHTDAGFSSPQAKRLAAKLCRAALAWGKTFQACADAPHAVCREQVCEETLAYSLCLLELRLGPPSAEAFHFLAEVRRECQEQFAQWQHLARTSRKQLSPPPPAQEQAGFANQYLMYAGRDSGAFRITEPMFQDFCEMTGLSSTCLVGTGPNLAALVFYIVLHGVFTAHRPISRERKRVLLGAAKSCRAFFEDLLDQWLGKTTAAAFSPVLLPETIRRAAGEPPHSGAYP